MRSLEKYLLMIVIFTCLLRVSADELANNQVNSRNWMSKIDDNTIITNLSIPGTHNSGTSGYKWPDPCIKYARCQELNILEQLQCGVRFLDLRIALVGKKEVLRITHGKCRTTFLTLSDAFKQIAEFLYENPTEAVICLLRVEEGDKEKVGMAIDDYIYDQHHGGVQFDPYDKNALPTLKECRGKWVYWRGNYDGHNCGVRVGWSGDASSMKNPFVHGTWLAVADRYTCLRETKEKHLQEWLPTAAEKTQNNLKTQEDKYAFLTFTSGYNIGGRIGPRPKKYANQINPFLMKYLGKHPSYYLYGIIAVDYVTEKLSTHIWQRNFMGPKDVTSRPKLIRTMR
jgi:1-phosphatidylinositol phosphodiesterase